MKIGKKGGKWYVFVHYQGRRKAKCVGTREAAEKVKRTLEAKPALGDLGFLADSTGDSFENYAKAMAETVCGSPKRADHL